MSHSRRTGFTLVELLVVITIIGMLMALLLPAVTSATANARTLKCKNRIKNIGMATVAYESRFSSYPGYAGSVQVGNNSRPVPLPWTVAILGDLDRGDILDEWNAGRPIAPFVDFLVCPSDPPLSKDAPETSYVANVGNSEFDLHGCGMLHSKFPGKLNGKTVAHATNSLDKVRDGASRTILISENIQAGFWADPNDAHPQTLAGSLGAPFITPPAQLNRDSRTGFGIKTGSPPANVFVLHDKPASQFSDQWLINGKTPSQPPRRPMATDEITLDNARPSSEHKGGVNVCFVDGHVQFLKEGIDYTVYSRLMSADGKKCVQSYLKQYGSQPNLPHTQVLSDSEYN